MITIQATFLAAAIAYGFAIIVTGIWTRRLPADARAGGYLLVGMLVVSMGASLLMWQELGHIPIAEGHALGVPIPEPTFIDAPRLIGDTVAYSVLFAVTGAIAGMSASGIGGLVGILVTTRIAFEVAGIAGGIVAPLGALTMLGGYGLFLYLFWGPVWRRAKQTSDDRRLLFWKCRNITVLLFGMLMILGAMYFLEPTSDQFVIEVCRQYLDVLIRVGYTAFIYKSLSNFESARWFSMRTLLRGNTTQ